MTTASPTVANESILDRLRQKSPATFSAPNTTALPAARAEEDESPFDLGTFGWLRGVKDQAIMLELRLRSGNVVAVSYAYIDRAEYDPSEGITLHVGSGKTVRIEGANLNASVASGARLFEGIVRRRVPWVRECSEGDAQAVRVTNVEF
jgi:hypothetical protein